MKNYKISGLSSNVEFGVKSEKIVNQSGTFVFTNNSETLTTNIRCNKIFLENGSLSSPALTFFNSQNSGIHHDASNGLRIQENGNLCCSIRGGANSILPVHGSTSMTVPIGTTAQRPTTPTQGMIRYNTSQNTYEFYHDNEWHPTTSRYFDGGLGYTHYRSTVTTTDATVTPLFIFPNTFTNVCALIDSYIVSKRQAGVQNAAYIRRARVYWNASSVPSILNVTNEYTSESVAAWDATIAAVSGTVRINVTGEAGVNINWFHVTKVIYCVVP